MNTPICDFVRRYAESSMVRMHMPGHKGTGPLGCEALDITEIYGADSLYEADGIIAKSEKNATNLFGCPTFYSTEGSSHCIRAMLHLVTLYARQQGCSRPLILAGRNVHKTFLSAAALLDLDVQWLYPDADNSYLACDITEESLERFLSGAHQLPAAVYITSPDYLGHMLDLGKLSNLCHHYGVLLLVDNAHGAYLKFLPDSQHPMDQGADLCCDSAHKTLPVLTGGAYLHIAVNAPRLFAEQAKNALALFGSTSPSYLILQSLDAANAILDTPSYRNQLAALVSQIASCRKQLAEHGFKVAQDHEPLKLTIQPKSYGYEGTEVADYLRQQRIECEFADPDFVVLMLTPAITAGDLHRLTDVLTALPPRNAILTTPRKIGQPEKVLSIREAVFSPCKTLPAAQCLGKILATASVGCPPAVPIVICGERIDSSAISCFQYYGIESCNVIDLQ